MQVFQIKGFSGLIVFVMALLALAALILLLPSAVMMVFWNALIFETLGGPEISIIQGLLLWIASLILFKLVANPQVSFQFKKLNDNDIDKHIN